MFMDNVGKEQLVILVLLEMGLSFFGIVANLLIVTTLRQEESLKGSTINYLLFNLCFSNLVISFLVKPISAIYIGYAFSTGEADVSLFENKFQLSRTAALNIVAYFRIERHTYLCVSQSCLGRNEKKYFTS